MATLTLELPAQEKQTVFNLRRWAEVLADQDLARIEGRVETDRYGRIVLNSLATIKHGMFQAGVSHLMRELFQTGSVIIECPVSTADGVRATDIAWASPERMRETGDLVCFPKAPEICVEVISPGNTIAEIQEKTALYFDAKAQEVWHCDENGWMTFLSNKAALPMQASQLCPEFPTRVELP